MITDASTIQKLSLRSALPRLKNEGFYLLAQLEPQEQALAEASARRSELVNFVDPASRSSL